MLFTQYPAVIPKFPQYNAVSHALKITNDLTYDLAIINNQSSIADVRGISLVITEHDF